MKSEHPDRTGVVGDAVGIVSLAAGVGAALVQASSLVEVMIVGIVGVGAVVEWGALRKESATARAAGSRLLIMVGAALLAAGMF